MKFLHLQKRRGTSLIELLLYLGFFALCAGTFVAVLLFTNEQRIRQQTVTSVEQEGIQLLQSLSRRVRRAERILLPAMGASGSILALQMSDQAQNPTIVYLQTGSIAVVEHDTARTLSSEKLTISDIVFRNTSATSERQSAIVSFTASRVIPLPTEGTYVRTFEMLINLFPDDDPSGDDCSCSGPVCVANSLTWEVCNDDTCSQATAAVPCG